MDWHPERPTLWQVALGIVFFVAIAGLSLYWSSDETGGNRAFLWTLAGMAVLMAAWRARVGLLVAREARLERRLRF